MSTRAQRQAAAQAHVRLTPRGKEAIDSYATANHLSRSEAMRWLISTILAGERPRIRIKRKKKIELAQRRTERIVFYDPDNLLVRLVSKAEMADTTATAILDRAIEEIFHD